MTTELLKADCGCEKIVQGVFFRREKICKEHAIQDEFIQQKIERLLEQRELCIQNTEFQRGVDLTTDIYNLHADRSQLYDSVVFKPYQSTSEQEVS